MKQTQASGPLQGVRVVEMAGLGPVPFCGMLLADLGADVVRIDRQTFSEPDPVLLELAAADRVLGRGRRSVSLDLKCAEGRQTALELIGKADILIEGFRPGVMERLGLGPDVVLAENPRIAYGRMTGWGQSGPLAQAAGHDINYLGLTGALHAIGGSDKPATPLNLVADFGGGALYLALGVLSALLHAGQTGHGQVVDCAMVDGAASLMSLTYGLEAAGCWADRRQANLLDGGRPYYDTYECSDERWLAVGPLEPQFFKKFCEILALPPHLGRSPSDHAELRSAIKLAFQAKSRDEWCAIFDGADACVTPVLSIKEAPQHPHNRERENFLNFDGVLQPAPAPRFSRTPGEIQRPAPAPGAHTQNVLAEWLGDDQADGA
jgi:alpha-methylacyl-CoA racemase